MTPFVNTRTGGLISRDKPHIFHEPYIMFFVRVTEISIYKERNKKNCFRSWWCQYGNFLLFCNKIIVEIGLGICIYVLSLYKSLSIYICVDIDNETLFPCISRVLPLVVPPTMSISYKRSSPVKEQTLGTQELTRKVPNHH